MAGAAFELAASFVGWLLDDDESLVAEAFGRIVNGCKTLSFKLARQRPFDTEPAIEGLAAFVEGRIEPDSWTAMVTDPRSQSRRGTVRAA